METALLLALLLAVLCWVGRCFYSWVLLGLLCLLLHVTPVHTILTHTEESVTLYTPEFNLNSAKFCCVTRRKLRMPGPTMEHRRQKTPPNNTNDRQFCLCNKHQKQLHQVHQAACVKQQPYTHSCHAAPTLSVCVDLMRLGVSCS